jgi:hypothetical protein
MASYLTRFSGVVIEKKVAALLRGGRDERPV